VFLAQKAGINPAARSGHPAVRFSRLARLGASADSATNPPRSPMFAAGTQRRPGTVRYPAMKYLVRRLLLAVPTLWAIYTITFLMVVTVPGNPFQQADRQMPEPAVTAHGVRLLLRGQASSVWHGSVSSVFSGRGTLTQQWHATARARPARRHGSVDAPPLMSPLMACLPGPTPPSMITNGTEGAESSWIGSPPFSRGTSSTARGQ